MASGLHPLTLITRNIKKGTLHGIGILIKMEHSSLKGTLILSKGILIQNGTLILSKGTLISKRN